MAPKPYFFLPLFQPRHMAPGQAPHQAARWRDAHPFFLLSPVMGFLSRAWSRLRGPGPPEPWLVEAVKGAEAGLKGEAKTPLTTPPTPWGGYSEEEAEDSGGPEGDREALGLKTSTSLPEAWGLSDDDDDKYSELEATSVPRGQGSQFADGHRAPLSPSLLIRTLQGSDKNSGEEKAEEEGVAEDEGVNRFSYPLSHRECCSAVEEEDDEAAAKKEACRTSPSALSPGSKPSTWVSCPGEEENQATEDEGRTEKSQGARETPMSPPSSGSYPTAWECHSGEASKEKKEKAQEEAGKGKAAPGPHSAAAQRPQLRAWRCQPSNEEEGEVKALGAAEKDGGADPPCIPATSAFLKAWVYQPGEDSEEEEGTFLKPWVYRPGEDTEEDEDSDSEDEEDDAEVAVGETESNPHPSHPAHSARFRDWVYQPGKETEEEEATEYWGEAEPCPFQVAIYVPGEKPPPPWAPPRLPLRLQRRLKHPESPTRDLDPETPLKARKVHFSEKVTVHLLAVWAGPAHAARRGPWEQFARDRSRFARRIAQAQELLSPCLTPAARARAWARLRNPPLARIPALTQTLPSSSVPSSPVQAMPLSQTVATPIPSCLGPLDLSGRCG
uniref:Protein phosphatase 1 regulatory subunit 15A n=1 Tax=Aotus nancymaae TaxID=37293 RepID=A0A2K5CYQ5_AOTNA